MQTQPLTALVVDDERLARRELIRILDEFTKEIRVIGEAANKKETLEFLQNPPDNLYPDVIFLDINMPHGSGFDVLEDIGYSDDESQQCEIVFITAYDEYAVRAFEVNVLDYLLKPIDPERLYRTIYRLWKKKRSTKAEKSQAPEHLIYSQESAHDSTHSDTSPVPIKLTMDDYVFVTIGKQRRFVQVQEIICITSSDNYTELWIADDKRAVMLRTMNEWELVLPEEHFQRIHRSTIINLSWIDTTYPVQQGGNLQVVLHGIAEPFAISRRYYNRLKEKF